MNIFKKVIQSPILNSKIILQGATGSGKSTILLERYKYMVEKLHIPSEKILILLLNRSQSLEWRSKTILENSGSIWRTSYYGFLQSEFRNYYPLLIKNCSEIVNIHLKPVFLTQETAQFLVSKVIERNRESKGIFAGITSSNDRISIDLTANLVKAATSDIPIHEIGDRLYNSLELKSEAKKQIFKDVDDILKAYRKRCLELGVFDFGMVVELYNNYLLKDDLYKAQLKNRVQHLIVDNVEECVPAEVDLIDLLMQNANTCLLSFNNEGGYGEIFGSNFDYAKKRLTEKGETILLKKSYTCNSFMYEFSDRLFDNIENLKDYKVKGSIGIERSQPQELRSEMLEEVAKRVCRLISTEGYRPSDIVILSTHADPVTEYVIERILEKQGYSLKNLAGRSRVVDNPFSQALITLAQICHPAYGLMPNRDDVKALLRILLNIDNVRSSILAGEVCCMLPFADFPDIEHPELLERIGLQNIEKYDLIKDWISDYKSRETPMPINEFFQKVFLELLISKEATESDLLQVKKLIDIAQSFFNIVTKFKRNASKDFLEMIKGEIKASESILELEEKLDGEFVLISTPKAYLASPINRKVTIITSLSSENWTPRSIKELTNSRVLTKTWDAGMTYTEEIEEKNMNHYVATLIRTIIKRCGEKLITFESNLSASGYENVGILADYFDEIMEDNYGT